MCKWPCCEGRDKCEGRLLVGLLRKVVCVFCMFFSLPICIPAFCVVSLQWQGKCGGASLF